MIGGEQLAFSFDSPGPAAMSGLDLWREMRRRQLNEMNLNLGLPIGCRVRIVLTSGPSVEGRLLLQDEELWLSPRRNASVRLRVGAVDFLASDVDSCILLEKDGRPEA